ncbi:MAG: YciI family protein [Gammaproteobacteria bacterium]
MQFVVTAMDYTDEDALNRRMQNREAHLDGAMQLIAEGRFLSGGAILDEQEKMIGSTLHLEFPDRESLEAHLHKDPYISGKVWETIEIREARLVPLK